MAANKIIAAPQAVLTINARSYNVPFSHTPVNSSAHAYWTGSNP